MRGPSPRLPLYSACAVIILLGVWRTSVQLLRPYPIHPWEAGLLAEAYRSATGLAVYEDARTGHATHMFGPLVSWTVGTVFRLTGPSFYPARVIALLSSLAIMALLFALFRPPGARRSTVVALGLLAGFGIHLGRYVEARPDALSIVLGL